MPSLFPHSLMHGHSVAPQSSGRTWSPLQAAMLNVQMCVQHVWAFTHTCIALL